jgi:hypothetical protein
MSSAMWKMGPRHGVVYVDDGGVAREIQGLAREQPGAGSEMAIYSRGAKRVGWQFCITMEIWERVANLLSRGTDGARSEPAVGFAMDSDDEGPTPEKP